MKVRRYNPQITFGVIFIIFGISAVILAILLFTPAFVANYLLLDHNITPGGIKLLNNYRLILSLGGLLLFLTGIIILMEVKKLREQLLSFIDHVYWGYPKTKNHFMVQAFLYIILFIIGIFFWIFFLHSDRLSLAFLDWIKENAYLSTLRLAQTGGVIPWQWSQPFFQEIARFLANPEVVLTPDIIFLRWLSNSNFVILHILLFYSLGYFGTYKLCKKLNARFVAFSLFWLIFNFNGYLTAQLAIGHFEWTGYFLFPFFFIFLFNFAEKSQERSFDIKNSLGMALLLGGLYLNGSVHIAIWCSIFLLIVLLFRWTLLINIIVSIFIGGMLGIGRLLPAALWFPKISRIFPGYPSFSTLLDAFTNLRMFNFPMLQHLGWWEYDIYIGFVAFTLLIILFAIALKRGKLPFQPFISLAGILFLLLSMGEVYFINKLPLPFVSIERVPSRFVVLPFILLLITSIGGIDALLVSWEKTTKTILLICLPFIAGELYFHFSNWRIYAIEKSSEIISNPIISLAPCSDHAYMNIVYASWAISFITLIVVLSLLLRNLFMNRRQPSANVTKNLEL